MCVGSLTRLDVPSDLTQLLVGKILTSLFKLALHLLLFGLAEPLSLSSSFSPGVRSVRLATTATFLCGHLPPPVVFRFTQITNR